jgi:hypothetical protein
MIPGRNGVAWRRLVVSWGVVVMAILVQAPRPQARAEDVGTVLARMREAAGARAFQRLADEVVIRGKCEQFESAGEYTLRFTAAGKFRQVIDGPLGDTHGFDGTTCWQVNRGGVPRTLELFDRDVRQLWVGMQTGQWLAGVTPAGVALVPGEDDEDHVVLDVKQGRLKARLYVSRTTWLPHKLRRTGVGGDQTWTFTRYRDDLGWKVPGKIAVQVGAGITDTYEVRSVTRAPAEAGAYDPVKDPPADARFNADASAVVELKRAPTGHVLVRAKVDGAGLGWFIFDTGAGATVLHRDAATRLDLTPVGASPVTSFLGSARGRIVRGKSLEIGPLTLARPFFVEMDLGFVRQAMGNEVVGIVGYDLLSRCVAELSLADDSLKIYDPQRYRPDSPPWQKLIFNRSLPLVPATFEGGKGLFRIDVGASGGPFANAVFHAPAVDELNLLKDRKVTITKLGPTRVALGKTGWFELAGHRFENPDVVFALDRQGPMGDEYVEGNLGVEFLKPFRIVLDYQQERVAFVRRAEGRR